MTIKDLCDKQDRCCKCPFNHICCLTDEANEDFTKSIIETAKMLAPSKYGYWIRHMQKGIEYRMF